MKILENLFPLIVRKSKLISTDLLTWKKEIKELADKEVLFYTQGFGKIKIFY